VNLPLAGCSMPGGGHRPSIADSPWRNTLPLAESIDCPGIRFFCMARGARVRNSRLFGFDRRDKSGRVRRNVTVLPQKTEVLSRNKNLPWWFA
jgi:hypothetical protein